MSWSFWLEWFDWWPWIWGWKRASGRDHMEPHIWMVRHTFYVGPLTFCLHGWVDCRKTRSAYHTWEWGKKR